MQSTLSSTNRSHRGEAVVRDVLEATREELARIGYRALRIDDVATRANVNRTTIYRRWPTKVQLVRATLRMMIDVPDDEPDTGSIRGDLLVVARHMLGFLTSANGQVLVRMMMAEGTEAELREVVDAIRRENDVILERLFERARVRGEIRSNLELDVFVPTMIGGLHHRIFALGIAPEAIRLEAHVDLLLSGALVR